MVRCVLNIFERDYKKGKKEIKEETLSPACSNSFERDFFFGMTTTFISTYDFAGGRLIEEGREREREREEKKE